MQNLVLKFLLEKDQESEDTRKLEELKVGDLENIELEEKIKQTRFENIDVLAWSQV